MNQLKQILIFIGLFLILQHIVAQDDINQVDRQGLKTGVWQGRYPDGSIRYKGAFDKNLPVGMFYYFYPDGTLRATNDFETGGLKAYHKAYSKQGKLMAEGIYLDQKKDSVWRIYSEKDGELISEETYKNNLLDGRVVVYYPATSQVAEETHYYQGIKQGVSRQFYMNGKLHTEATYKNDLPEGAFVEFFESGQKKTEGYFNNGLKNGVWKIWDEDGMLISEETHQNED